MKGDIPGPILAITTILFLVALAAVAARLYARRLRKQILGLDDYSIIAALFFTLMTAICMWIGASPIGGLGRHAPIIPGSVLPVLNYRLRVTLGVSYGSLSTSTLAIGLTKISVLWMYRRIFAGPMVSRWFNIVSWSLITFCVLWTVIFFFLSLLECHPISANWTAYGGTAQQCINEFPFYLAQCWIDVISDAFILLFPVPLVWRLHLNMQRKIAVMGIFLLGAVTLAFSAAKLAIYNNIITTLDDFSVPIDLTWLLTPTMYWAMAESAAGILGACLPLIKPIFDCFVMPVWIQSAITGFSSNRYGSNMSASKPQTGATADEEMGAAESLDMTKDIEVNEYQTEKF